MQNQDSKSSRRRGNPNMRKGAPSVNPHGRPAVGQSLATALRRRFSPEEIVARAASILEGDTSPDVKLQALEFVARRGYQRSLKTLVRAMRRASAEQVAA